MKKAILALAIVALGCGSANAQEGLQKAKFFDNWYLGAKIGASTPLTFNHTFPLNPNFGLKLGKNFSPVFGANFEALANFGENRFVAQVPENLVLNSKTAVKSFNFGLNGTINWTNLFLGYNENKVFELGTELGIGFNKYFGDKALNEDGNVGDNDDLTAKTSMTFAWNIGGASKPVQLYIEPGIYWNLTHGPKDAVQMDKRCAQLALQVGLNYKFKTSNGTHNFKKLDVTPLNDEINDLRAQLAQKPKEVVKEVIKEVPVEKETTKTNTVRIDNLFFVTFQQGKSALVPEMKKALNNIKSGSHVEIVGTASPEGSKELNDRLSQARADAVASYLKTRGVIVDSASGKGVQGVTSNRLAVVYVK
ncbi:MAG TPA: cell envelope biogenesis protein OmpA [Prevotella sp.]|nr:cell envelope biogenesis protein OmpA [Prevotella sp.]